MAADRRKRLRRIVRPAWSFRLLRTTGPIGTHWGWDRGTPVDRHYIEGFLERHRGDIRGRVLEIKGPLYTNRFGAGVTSSDVLDLNQANAAATIHADLAAADAVPSESFDCAIVTQTLQLILDVRAALAELRRMLVPGGVLLATVPTTSRVVSPGPEGVDYWRFTPSACTALFGSAFGPDNVVVEPHGNLSASVAFLHGLAAEELPKAMLDVYDPNFPLVVGIRAVKETSEEGLARRR